MKIENRRMAMFVAFSVMFAFLIMLIIDMFTGSRLADGFLPIATFFIGWALRDTREPIVGDENEQE